MKLHKFNVEEAFEQFFPISVFFFLSLSYLYSLWKFNFNVQSIDSSQYSLFFEIFFKKLSIMSITYNIAYLMIIKRKLIQALAWGLSFTFFLLIDNLFSFYFSSLSFYLKKYESISTPGSIHFLFTFFFLSFMNITKPEKIDLSILPLLINFAIGLHLADEPVLNENLKFILLTPFLLAILSSNRQPYKEISIIITSAILFISVKSVVTFCGIFSIFLKSLAYILPLLSIFFSAFISLIAFASGYFSFLIFQKGIPFDQPFEFLSHIHISLIGVSVALLIFTAKIMKNKMEKIKIKKSKTNNKIE